MEVANKYCSVGVQTDSIDNDNEKATQKDATYYSVGTQTGNSTEKKNGSS